MHVALRTPRSSPALNGVVYSLLTFLKSLTPQPALMPVDSYYETFHNLTGAIQASDYLTYDLVETIADCQTKCDSTTGCGFVNTYLNANGKQNGSSLLTCALFKNCHDSLDANNYGGQVQPDGGLNYIANSDGWCQIG
ncbi:hypothetical protein AX15_006720 [Amanita polypyramis BW_CC]|nr:hypothetical protein AX15_006720 [Amanita polypyramis BW_CC]